MYILICSDISVGIFRVKIVKFRYLFSLSALGFFSFFSVAGVHKTIKKSGPGCSKHR